MRFRLKATLLAALAATALAGTATTARGDADPASDVLPLQNVYFPYQSGIPSRVARELDALTAQTKKLGYPLKVALIAQPEDLGAVPDFFGKPSKYAEFLGIEISFNRKQPLLVVMPAGLGVYAAGGGAQAAVKDISVPSDANGETLARTAIAAVEKLSAAAGHPVRASSLALSDSKRSGGSAPVVVFVVPVLLLAAAAVVANHRRRRLEDGEQAPPPGGGA